MRFAIVVLVACGSKEASPPLVTKPTSPSPTTPDAGIDKNAPRAIALFRAGLDAQCEAAAHPRFVWLRSDSKWAVAFRSENPGVLEQSEADFKARCLKRKGKVGIAPDIVLALEVMDRYLDRKAYFDDNPYVKDGTKHPNQGEDAFVEAIIESDPRMKDLGVQINYCFAWMIKEAMWHCCNEPGIVVFFEKCVAAPAASYRNKRADCIVAATYEAQITDCPQAESK